MEPENPTPPPELESTQPPLTRDNLQGPTSPYVSEAAAAAPERRGIRWVFIGPKGLRAGWSIAIFLAITTLIAGLLEFLLNLRHLLPQGELKVLTVRLGLAQEGPPLLAIVLAAWIVSKIEGRRLSDYYLRGPGPVSRFFWGAATGLVALSILILVLTAGGWMQFEGLALSGSRTFLYAAGWGVVFLLVACFEEGLVRCFLLFTLGRGLNFWWSLGLVALLCGRVAFNAKANGAWGTLVIAGLGLAPCLLLYMKKAPSEGFWDAAWVTSVMFGAGHTGNSGESWVGIFSAAGIGLVFCASVRLTGSVWWAIGCHAAWDWGQSYLYGTPDSGLMAKGHLLNSTYSQQVIWSGGSTGPEGSILIIPGMVFIFLVLLLQYGHKRRRRMAFAQQAS